MKRMAGKRDPNHESDDGCISDESKRLRRRRRQMGTDDAIHNHVPRTLIANHALTAPQQVQVATTIHNIETIGEHIFLPDYVREHNSTLTFPEKLMLTLTHVDRERSKKGIPESGECIGWVYDGTAFVVQNIDQLCATWLPLFFGQSKFSSFTRKLYRWGFRKVNVASIPNGSSYRENALFFGNEHFLRSDKSQLTLMRSVTAAKTRSGTAGPLTRIALPTAESNNVGENTSQYVLVDTYRSHQPQIPRASVAAGEDVASLIQQSVNLQSLLTFLSSNQQGVATVFNQLPPHLLNPMLTGSQNTSSVPSHIPQASQTDMGQMLQQLSASAALLRASGAIQTQPPVPVPTPVILAPTIPNVPWWMTASIPAVAQPPTQLLSFPPMLGWPPIVNAAANLQQLTPQHAVDQERLRGVVDTFVRYCESLQQQQQQGASRPPPQPPSDNTPPP